MKQTALFFTLMIAGFVVASSHVWAQEPTPDTATLQFREVLRLGEQDRDSLDWQIYASLSWSPDGKRLASLVNRSGGDRIDIWDMEIGEIILEIPLEIRTYDVAWSPVGDQIAAVNYVPSIQIWDAQTAQLQDTLQAPQESNLRRASFTSLAWSPDGTRIATAGLQTWVWSVAEHQSLWGIPGYYAVAWSPDGTRLANTGGEILLLDAVTGELLNRLNGQRTAVWSPNGNLLASASLQPVVKIWDANAGKEIISLETDGSRVFTLAWSPDASLIAGGDLDGMIYLWDAATYERLTAQKGHTDVVLSLAWNSQGQFASVGRDEGIHIWDVD